MDQCINEVVNTVYAESRGTGEMGMKAVVHVIMNRSKDQKVRPCVIVRQPNQFARGKSRPSDPAWQMAKKLVLEPGKDITRGARYFHNLTVKPSWSYRFRVTMRLGRHIFYKP